MFKTDPEEGRRSLTKPKSLRQLSYRLIEGDNVQAIGKLAARDTLVKLAYLDPPYNTGRHRGARKSFRDSANGRWRGDVLGVVQGCYRLLDPAGFAAVSINQMELFNLKSILDEVFGADCFVGLFPVKIRHDKRQLMINATFHDLFEYLLIYRKSKSTRFVMAHKAARADKFVHAIDVVAGLADVRTINGKRVEIFQPEQYAIRKIDHAPEALRRYVIAGKLATANWSGEWYEKHLRQLGDNLLIKVWGLENEGLGYRWFQTGNERRRSGVYFQSQLNAGRPILPSNDLDFTEVVPTIYKEGGPGCDFKDSKKPEALLRFLIEICTEPGDTVLDPYAGSGTMLAVAVKTGRSAVLIENDPAALRVFRQRAENLRQGRDLDGLQHRFTLQTTVVNSR